ncbi:YbjQ family protein [Acinetobacter rudis]|uniref:Uncharacterized protein n=1 Tax=Acinetobacter rudis CIP 110305 TaxID=421052 RepID=S3NNG1_9GAMM|nr:heavy metal-binding domain-containing protein [Acinetobacter rudis]EPF79898.1 hypothetical protein F945_00786 [Acinetobacter rudis CIP 110305]
MEGLIFKVVVFLFLFFIGWGFGRHIERSHLQALDEKERRLSYIRLDTSRFKTSDSHGQLLISNVVISHDYFKMVWAAIHNFFGGRLLTYESVTERARREAIIRLKLQAEQLGATQLLGLRLNTTEIGMQGGMVEVFAYATAILPETAAREQAY